MSLGPNFLGKTPGPDSGPFSAVANITAKSESDLKEIMPLLLAVQKNANSNNEPDCTEYKVIQAHDDPLAIVVYEQYNSADALSFHYNQEDFQKFAKAAGEKTSVAHLRFYKHITQ
ncbi:uncharacterized protein FA14DRAFT_177327 [Meira miltonrushii]|uniref:ABM domain-containing protein n=1 Tax=Meira miltonrushii TaxID=1280837 RepID=A0A316VPH4_9BASI|nr:uncharacterized protein FA14DRAFT_177327 [Meira miltonrushii]PWN38051.1 hypothetical protein FA14DRAFT_177327 [Meira miltonrushii]